MLLRLVLLISSKYSLITSLIYALLLRYFFHLLLLLSMYLQRRPKTQIEVCSGNKSFDDTMVKLYDYTIVIIYLC